MDLGLAGDTALVTASSSGLGKAAAIALASQGTNVVINGRDPDRLAEARDEVESVAEGSVSACRGDLTDPSEIEHLVTSTVDTFGGIDHLVTSAGGPPRRRFFEATDEEWYEAFELLAMSVVRLVRASAPHLRSNGGGTVVNVTSISTREPIPTNVLSSTVRTVVVGLMKALSRELAPEVRANAVLPGVFDTPRREDPGDAGIDADAVPLVRLGEPLELGRTVAFLCSPRSGYITGATVPIDGGSSHAVF